MRGVFFIQLQFTSVLLAYGLSMSLSADAKDVNKVLVRKKPPPPDYWPMRLDYWWKYQTETADGVKSGFTIKDIADEKQDDKSIWHKLEIDSGVSKPIHDWYVKARGWVLLNREVYVSNGMKCVFAPPKQILKDPLLKGDTWQWDGTGMMDAKISETNTVSGPDEIVVPAGKFLAMKVVTQSVQGGASVTKTYWYAPFIGIVQAVSESGSVKSTSKLVEYHFPKLQPGEKELSEPTSD